MTSPLIPQNNFHTFSKNLRTRHEHIYSVDTSKRKLKAKIAELWETSRQNQKLSKKNFIKQNMQIVSNLNRLNQIKELDPFSRKLLFDNYLKTCMRGGLGPKQKQDLFAQSMRSKGKTEESDQFLTSCPTSELWPKRRSHRKNFLRKTHGQTGRFNSLRKTRAVAIKTANKTQTKSYVIKTKIPAKIQTDEVAKTCRSMGRTHGKQSKVGFLSTKLKTSRFDCVSVATDLERQSMLKQENEFERVVARSLQQGEKRRSLEHLENIVIGRDEGGIEKHVLDSSNPVALNCGLKKLLLSYQDRLKALKTKRNYTDKHKAKLGRILGR